jgi:hypothetical protein
MRTTCDALCSVIVYAAARLIDPVGPATGYDAAGSRQQIAVDSVRGGNDPDSLRNFV